MCIAMPRRALGGMLAVATLRGAVTPEFGFKARPML